MGERATIDQDYLHGAADAIRRKNGTSNTYTPAQFEAAIDGIPTGGITPTGTINITENGSVDVTQYATANVNVSGGGGGGATILSGADTPTSAVGSDGNVYLQTSGLLQPLVTSESELTVTVTANTNWGGYEPWKAFASGTGTGWIGYGGNPHWLQIEFVGQTKVTGLDFKSFDSSRSHAISRIGVSNDGSNFTDITLTESTMVSNIGHVTIGGAVKAKYCRLYFDGDYSISTYPMVSQLEMYGEGTTIYEAYVKASGAWQPLIGSDVSDVGGVTA